jgi:hypothetical protein
MHATVTLIISSCKYGYIKVIACEYLVREVDNFVSFVSVLFFKQMIFHFPKINLRGPWVWINHSYKYFVGIYVITIKEGFL